MVVYSEQLPANLEKHPRLDPGGDLCLGNQPLFVFSQGDSFLDSQTHDEEELDSGLSRVAQSRVSFVSGR